MSIVILGGHKRMSNEYKQICKGCGHKVKIYNEMPSDFKRKIGKPDAVLLFTKTVSHKMVNVLAKEAKKSNLNIVRVQNSSGNALKNTVLGL